MKGYRTILAMGLALAVALYQQFAGDIPAVDPTVLNIAVPIVAVILRFITTTPVGDRF